MDPVHNPDYRLCASMCGLANYVTRPFVANARALYKNFGSIQLYIQTHIKQFGLYSKNQVGAPECYEIMPGPTWGRGSKAGTTATTKQLYEEEWPGPWRPSRPAGRRRARHPSFSRRSSDPIPIPRIGLATGTRNPRHDG
jgi:hypothetical protein